MPAARALAISVLRSLELAADQAVESVRAAEADLAIEPVGRVPLAVALLTAAVRGRRTWGQVTDQLIQAFDVFGNRRY